MPKEPSQLERFKQATRALECAEDEAPWDDRLRKMAAHRSPPEKPE